MAVRVLKIDAPASFTRVELPVFQAPGPASITNAGLLDTLENGVKLFVSVVKRVVVPFEGVGVVEIECKILIDFYRRKMPHGTLVLEAENLREKPRRSLFIMRGHNRMIQFYCHHAPPREPWSSSRLSSIIRSNTFRLGYIPRRAPLKSYPQSPTDGSPKGREVSAQPHILQLRITVRLRFRRGRA